MRFKIIFIRLGITLSKQDVFKKQWQPNTVLYEETNEDLTGAAGLGTMIDMFAGTRTYGALHDCLPERNSNASYDTRHLAFIPICGFWQGYDCLDDLEKFRSDPIMRAKLGEMPRAKTVGDYLRDFDEENLRKTNEVLTLQALEVREKAKITDDIILDIDSTPHEQSGKKIEGVAWNYKGMWCLDSLKVYDERGLCYGMLLRPGNTFSAEGSVGLLRDILKNITEEKRKKITVRADSAFCNEDFIRMCLLMGTKFSITCHGNMKYEEEAKGLTNWKPWNYTTEEVEESQKKNLELPKREINFYMYEPGWAKNLKFSVVVKKTWCKEILREQQKGSEEVKVTEKWGWKYYGVITNRGLYPLTMQEILEFHAKRGNSENFIKEEKYGYDLKHFPCQKLKANHAYGLLALIAANFLRCLDIIRKPNKPSFSKNLRHKLIAIPGKLISHSGKLIMKIPTTHYKERESMITAWRATPIPSFSSS
jgi:hypothetical protein